MSNLVRRIQRMAKRKTKGAQKRMMGMHVGDRLGVTNEVEPLKRQARGSRRGKHSKKWLATREKKEK